MMPMSLEMIVLRLLVKLKMHNSVFVYIIIILINDCNFSIWLIEHKLGWLQQCIELSQSSFLCNTVFR